MSQPDNTQQPTSQDITEGQSQQEMTPAIQESKIPHLPKFSQDNLSLQVEQEVQQSKEEKNIKTVSNFGGMINLFKTYIGSGMLALPYSFNQAGYLYGVIFLVTLGSVVFYINTLLVRVGQKLLKPGQSYSDLCEKLLSKKLAYFMKVVLVFSCLSACISYVIFFVTFFEHALGDNLPKIVYLIFALIIIFPITMITNIGGLVRYSFLANGIIVLTIISVLVQNFIDIFENSDSPASPWQQNKNNLVNVEKTSLMIGVGLFSFDASYVLMGIRDSLRKPEQFTSRVLSSTTVFVAILYVLFACTSVLAKGHDMEEIILFAFDNTYFTVLQMLYAVALALTYPVFFCTAARIMENKEGVIARKFIQESTVKRVIFRVFITLGVVVFAFLVPRFAIVINLFGSISGAASQFGFPLFAFYKVFKDQMGGFQKGFNFLVLLIGLGGCGLGIYGSIAELI